MPHPTDCPIVEPGPDASDEEITAYLDHSVTCPYHGALEKALDVVVAQAIVAKMRGSVPAGEN